MIGIAIAGSGSIDKVAGPVGEALIMTALGLLVAVPAVFAYNWLQNRNKRISEVLSAFSTDILAFLTSGGTVKPQIVTKTSTQQAAKTTAPASAPKA
jgi:biopolymer transport protein ExbB